MIKNISFKDKENTLFKLKIELKEGRFSISGEGNGSCGQCQDGIKPASPEQQQLLKIWEKWHLNDLNAGTEKQEEALKTFKPSKKSKLSDYEQRVNFLKKKRLYSDGGHKYGSAWLKRQLPDYFWQELNQLCDKIETQEKAKKREGGNWEEIEDKKIIALGRHLELNPAEALQDITTSDERRYTYCGTDYWVLTDDEAEEEAKTYLTDDTYLYQCWVEKLIKDKMTEDIKNIDDWAEWVIDSDGYGSILNGWDGREEEQDGFIIMRC